jgi:hypothetical protein
MLKEKHEEHKKDTNNGFIKTVVFKVKIYFAQKDLKTTQTPCSGFLSNKMFWDI